MTTSALILVLLLIGCGIAWHDRSARGL